MGKSSFVGKCFITTEHYHTPSGVRPAGFCGDVLSKVGNNCYLIRCWKEAWYQKVVSAEFFIEANARIYDTFAELKAGEKKAVLQ